VSIIEIVATRCQILRIKCIKFDFGWGSAPDLNCLGSLQRSPDPLAALKGPTSSRREGVRGGEEREGKGIVGFRALHIPRM